MGYVRRERSPTLGLVTSPRENADQSTTRPQDTSTEVAGDLRRRLLERPRPKTDDTDSVRADFGGKRSGKGFDRGTGSAKRADQRPTNSSGRRRHHQDDSRSPGDHVTSGQPFGGAWSPSTIYGSVKRGTGILNNELYLGRLVWNRLRYVKNPDTGKRVSRMNPPPEWMTREVPTLRIVSDEG